MNPDKGLFLFMIFATCGFVTETVGMAFYVGNRITGGNITASFILAIVGFVCFAFAAIAYKKLHGKVYG